MYIQLRDAVTLPGPGPATTAVTSSSSSSASTTSTPTAFPHSFVAGGGLPTATSLSTAKPAPTETGTSRSASNTSHKSVNKRPIIGGVIGGVIFLGLAIGLLWFVLRRRRRREMDSMARGFTPMLGSNGIEKFAMDSPPDMAETSRRTSGGVFGPFGGYHRTPSVEQEGSRSMDIDDSADDAPLVDSEKSSLVAPPAEEHPALHPLPGVSSSTPTYYPGGPQHPAYNTLPSQRGRHPTHISLGNTKTIPERSPVIPDFAFSPVELLPLEDRYDTVPITPQAELAAFPSPPKSIASQLKRHMTPPRKTAPHRRSTPPRMSLPLGRLTPDSYPSLSPPSSTHPTPPRPSPPRKSYTAFPTIVTTMSRKPTPRHLRPRTLTYPSPTAGGRPELPASLPVAKTPKNPIPQFNHISLPSPQEPGSASSVRRHESTNTTYSIPIGLGVEPSSRNANWPLNDHPVTSDAHHLRNQPSNISALSAVRDMQNASAVSALTILSTADEQPEAELQGDEVPLKPNHSRQWTEGQREHVMSWQNYSSPASPIHGHGRLRSATLGDETSAYGDMFSEVSPMFSPPNTAGGNGVVSPMFSPPLPGQAGYGGFSYNNQRAGADGRLGDGGGGGGGGKLNIKVGLTPMIGNKKFSQRSLEKRDREREDHFSDLSVQPLNPGRRDLRGMRGMASRKATY